MTRLKSVAVAAKAFALKVKQYISPVFIILLVASFVLWYFAKLSYTYTTEFDVKVNVDGERFTVPCVVEGKGTNLFGYSVYTSRRVSIPLEELKYEVVEKNVAVESDTVKPIEGIDSVKVVKVEPQIVRKVHIDPISLRGAISVRFSDIKIISVGNIPEIDIPEK